MQTIEEKAAYIGHCIETGRFDSIASWRRFPFIIYIGQTRHVLHTPAEYVRFNQALRGILLCNGLHHVHTAVTSAPTSPQPRFTADIRYHYFDKSEAMIGSMTVRYYVQSDRDTGLCQFQLMEILHWPFPEYLTEPKDMSYAEYAARAQVSRLS